MSHDPPRAETIQGQNYQVAQQLKTHTDYFEPNTAEYIKFAGKMGKRTWIFMIF
jgi:prolyl 4-hydroxylase